MRQFYSTKTNISAARQARVILALSKQLGIWIKSVASNAWPKIGSCKEEATGGIACFSYMFIGTFRSTLPIISQEISFNST